ncbi:MAG: hypothetical protein Q4B54_01825, partial [Coriobacteriales bacterium]|nr:hypothetical protein [Coriobacteriales bacterium]
EARARAEAEARAKAEAEANAAQNQSQGSAKASTSINANNLPRSWDGTYEGYTTYTSDGIIIRGVSITLDNVSSNGNISGSCHIYEVQNIDGVTRGSYRVEGSIDWSTGRIRLEGTTWIDKGGLISVGGFSGTVSNSSGWRITGQWYDPEGEVDPGNWNMSAV